MKLHVYLKLGILLVVLTAGWQKSFSQIELESTAPNDTTSDVGVLPIPGNQLIPSNTTLISGRVNRLLGIIPEDLVDVWNLPDTTEWPFSTNVSGILTLEQFAGELNWRLDLAEYDDSARSVLFAQKPIDLIAGFSVINLNRDKYYSIKFIYEDNGIGAPFFDWQGTYNVRFSLTAGAGAGSGSIGLPVEWRSFETSIEGQSVLLTWSTFLEENNQGFYIERSTDAETWESIGFVEGAGNSQEVQEYSFLDDFPNIGYNYYRLQQVDFNGDNDYSVIREIVLDPGTFTDALNVFPNPVQDILNITPIIGILHIRDLSGRVVYESTLNGARTEISMGAYPSGIYLIEIQPYNQSRKVFRVVH